MEDLRDAQNDSAIFSKHIVNQERSDALSERDAASLRPLRCVALDLNKTPFSKPRDQWSRLLEAATKEIEEALQMPRNGTLFRFARHADVNVFENGAAHRVATIQELSKIGYSRGDVQVLGVPLLKEIIVEGVPYNISDAIRLVPSKLRKNTIPEWGSFLF